MRRSDPVVWSWDELADRCRELALQVARSYHPDVVVGVARTGTLPGALIALLLGCDFQSLRVPAADLPARITAHLPARRMVAGRRVLLVDERASAGGELDYSINALRRLGAQDVRIVLLFDTAGAGRADYAGPRFSRVVLQPWVKDVAMLGEEIQRRRSHGGHRPNGPAREGRR